MKEKFAKYFGKLPEGHNPKIPCQWHVDSDPSLQLNYDTGECHCYGCGVHHKIDDLLRGCDKTIDPSIVEEYHKRLLSDPALVQSLCDTKAYDLQTIIQYKIGYNGDRFTYPVYNLRKEVVNIRMYQASRHPKMISFGTGYGRATWFPWPPTEPTIFLMEGESDTLVARQMGLPAYCHTGGAGTWHDQFSIDLQGKTVHIFYDIDKAGRSGARMVINALKFTCIVRDIRIPICDSKHKDFSDWVIYHGGCLDAVNELVSRTCPHAVAKVRPIDGEATPMPLWETGNAKWALTPVEVEVQIGGKDRQPYVIPYKVKCNCRADKKSMCSGCNNGTGEGRYTVDWKDGKIIRLVGVNDTIRSLILAEICGLPIACARVEWAIEEYQNIERVALLPKKNFFTNRKESEGINEIPRDAMYPRCAYYLGAGLQSNGCYRVRALPLSDPKTQASVLLMVEAEPMDIIEEVTDTKPCEIFRLKGVEDGIGQATSDTLGSGRIGECVRDLQQVGDMHTVNADVLQRSEIPVPR